MGKVLVIYYSRTGTTKEMAHLIAQAIKEAGVQAQAKDVSEVKPKELLDYAGIIVGSPTYYGTMSAQIKTLFDESVAFHGKLDGKVGGAFSSSANVAGGNETTIMDIIAAMLIHGMIVQGDYQGDHYGPVALGRIDERVRRQCQRFGRRIAELVKLISKE